MKSPSALSKFLKFVSPVVGFLLAKVDAEDILFFSGLALIALGTHRILGSGYPMLIVGVVLILSLRPLRRWF